MYPEQELKPFIAVGILIENEQGEIFLAKSPKWGGRWIVPGGHLDYGETLENCVRRETMEELAVNIRDIKFVHIQDAIDVQEQGYEGVPRRHFVFINYSAHLADAISSIKLDGVELQEFCFVRPEVALADFNLNKSTRIFIEDYLKRQKGDDIVSKSVWR